MFWGGTILQLMKADADLKVSCSVNRFVFLCLYSVSIFVNVNIYSLMSSQCEYIYILVSLQ